MEAQTSNLAQIVASGEQNILSDWMRHLKNAGATGGGRISEAELQTQCRDFLSALRQTLAANGSIDIQASSFAELRDMLGDISRSRAIQGFSPGPCHGPI